LSRACAAFFFAEALTTPQSLQLKQQPRRAALVAHASRCSDAYNGGPISITDVAQEEIAILKTHNAAPTVVTWISLFEARFDVLTGGYFKLQVGLAAKSARQHAKAFIMQVPTSTEQPPRDTALACFSLGLVAEQLVSPNHCCPDSLAQAVNRLASSLSERRLTPAGEVPRRLGEAAVAALEGATLQHIDAIRKMVLPVVSALFGIRPSQPSVPLGDTGLALAALGHRDREHLPAARRLRAGRGNRRLGRS